MDTPQKRKWSGRAFVSLSAALSFFALIASSLVLYVMPAGRDAYWTNWKLVGLTKDQWDAVHTVGGFAFVFLALVHLVFFNWKPFWNYVRSRIRRNLNRKAELAAAVLLNAALIAVCVGGWFPSSTVMGWMASIKGSWGTSAQKAPYGHAELEKLSVLAERTKVDLPAALAGLAARGLTVDADKTVQFIADANKMTPAEFFALLAPYQPKSQVSAEGGSGGGEGGGWGRKTVKDAAAEAGLSVEAAVAKLKARGVEAKPGDNLRALSGKAGLTPLEIASIIRD